MESRAEKRIGAVPENSEKKTLKKKRELKSRKEELTKKLTSQKGKTEGSAGEKMIFQKESKEALTKNVISQKENPKGRNRSLREGSRVAALHDCSSNFEV